MTKGVAAVVLAAMFLGCYGAALGADWIRYGESDGFVLACDRETIDGPPDGIRRVSTKATPLNEEKRRQAIDRLSKVDPTVKWDRYEYTVALQEIICTTRESRTLYTRGYGAQGLLTTLPAEPGGWKPIVPDTAGENLYKIVCSQPKEEKK